MKVSDWFNNGCNYEEGVLIYAGLKHSKPNLLRLFKLKKTNYNLEKLKNELSKYKEVRIKETVITEVASEKTNHTSTASKKVNPQVDIPIYKPLLIRDLPVALHPTFIKQKSDYATACSLKMQLNDLGPEEDGLQLCLQIEELFDAIEAAWKVLDHYTETNTILEVKNNDFGELTAAQLILKRNSRRSSLTKAKKLVEKYNRVDVTKLQKSQKTKLAVNLQRQLEKIAQLEIDVNELTKLINT